MSRTQEDVFRTGLIALGLFLLLAAPDGVAQLASVEWGTYIGGAGYECGDSVAADESGGVYTSGVTNSSGWVSGGWNESFNGGTSDVYVLKMDTNGAHVWSTYVGGTGIEVAYGITVDTSANVYLTGWTDSPGWTSGGWDTILDGTKDGYVVKLDTAGAHLWSSYLGGTNDDVGGGIAVDSSGNAYATGHTNSSGWVSNGWDTILGGTQDSYVVKLDTAGAHQWSSYLGGANNDEGRGIAVDAGANVYLTGWTDSSGWVSDGWDTTLGGTRDSYVVKLDTAGVHLWSSYLGGTNADMGYGIAVDLNGNVYPTGYTTSAGWISGGWDTTTDGGSEGYVVKLDTAGAHVWSSYLGGTGAEVGYAIAVDLNGNVYPSGYSESDGWVSGGWDTTCVGVAKGYVVKLDAAGAHQWSSYMGSTFEMVYGIVGDIDGNVYITGHSFSVDGWVSGGWDTTPNAEDSFLLKIVQPPDAPSNPGATAIGADTITWTWQDNSLNETGFKLYDDPGVGPPVTLRTLTAANVQAWQRGLNANTQYAFQVSATNADGDSAPTSNFTAWTLAATPIAPVVGNPGVDTLDVIIGAGDGNPAGTLYAILVSPLVDGYTWVQADGSVGMNPVYQTAAVWDIVTVTGLEQGMPYTFQVIAQNSGGVDTSPGAVGNGVVSVLVPVAGIFGLAAMFGGCLLAGAVALRRKR